MSNGAWQHDETNLRLDPAHESHLANEEVIAPSNECVRAAAGQNPAHTEEQVQHQAHQLASALSHRQREIDRRESQFNAFLATTENEARATRLMLNEKVDDLAQREAEVRTRLESLATREAELSSQQDIPTSAVEADRLQRLQQELNERQIRLEAEHNQLIFQHQQLQTHREAGMQLVRHLMRSLERRRSSLEEEFSNASAANKRSQDTSELNRFAAELDERSAELEAQREELGRQLQKLKRGQDLVKHENEQLEQQRQQERIRTTQQQERDRVEFEQREQAIARRSQELTKRQTMLDQMQCQVTQSHREAIELRLTTEQLWSQLGEQISPTEMAQALAHLRAKLSEHYRTSEETLATKREELQAMAQRLGEQQQALLGQRDELQQNMQRHQEEIEYQAARLVAREQELDAQQQGFEQQRERWHQQREAYEDQIHQLRAELRRGSAAAA